MAVDIAAEFLKFSATLPIWQQDALRRTLTGESLSEKEIAELVALAKHESGVGPEPAVKPSPLSADHLNLAHTPGDHVAIEAIHSFEEVNALVDGQRLDFDPLGLTVVYGENGTGKSGYTRVLRKACRARKAPDLVPDIHDPSPGIPTAKFSVRVAEATSELTWRSDGASPRELARFYVFDRECERCLVDEQGELAFLPAGLDSFRLLADAVERVKAAIENEDTAINPDSLLDLPSLVAASKPHADIVASILPDLADKKYQELLETLSSIAFCDDDAKRLSAAQKTLQEAADPAAKAKELRDILSSVKKARQDAETTWLALNSAVAEKVRHAWEKMVATKEAASLAGSGSFDMEPLPGIGSKTWRELYRAAEKFATTELHSGHPFVQGPGESRCPLCLQVLDDEAKRRFSRFRESVAATVQESADAAKLELDTLHSTVRSQATPDADEYMLGRLASLLPERGSKAADLLRDFPSKSRIRQTAILSAADEASWNGLPPIEESVISLLKESEQDLEQHAVRMEELIDPAATTGLKTEIAELQSKSAYTANIDRMKKAILDRRRIAALRRCHNPVNTRKITSAGKAISEKLVVSGLIEGFHEELRNLGGSNRINATIGQKGDRGKTVYGIALSAAGAIKAKRSEILSEGEQRVVGLAFFLAEVRLAHGLVGVVFDDPVTSLDHRWARKIAERIVGLAKERQVILFTHSIAFLIELDRIATRQSVPLKRQYISRGESGPGYCDANAAPWEKLDVGQRVDAFRRKLAGLKQEYDKSPDGEDYKNAAISLCNKLRASWERVVEELVFNGVVERFGYVVKTQSLAGVSCDDETYKTITDAMTRLSAETDSHDHAQNDLGVVMAPSELESEINGLAEFAKGRKKAIEALEKTRRKLTRPPASQEVVVVPMQGSAGSPRNAR